MQLTKDVQGIKCTNITRNLKSFIKSFAELQFHCQSLPEEDKEVAVNANVVIYKGHANKAEMLAALTLTSTCEERSVTILLSSLFITPQGGDEVLPVRHPWDHVDHGHHHDPGHHQPGGPDSAQLLLSN